MKWPVTQLDLAQVHPTMQGLNERPLPKAGTSCGIKL